MAIRVSSNQMVYNYKKQLNAANSRQTKLMEQGDGSKLHRPSDDSVDYTKYLRYSISENENNQYQENVSTAVSWMKASDDALVSMTDIQKTFKEKTVAAANDTNTTSDRAAIGKEMMAEIQELVSLGNTQSGDRYLFAGQSDLIEPFSLSESAVDRGLAKTLSNKAASYFSGKNGVDSGDSVTQMLTLTGSNQNTYYLNTKDGYIYTKDFVENGYKDRTTQDENAYVNPSNDAVGRLSGWSSTDDQGNAVTPTETVAKYFKNTGEIIDKDAKLSGATDVGEGGVSGLTFTFTTIRQNVVTYSGDADYISMTKRNGTTEPTADTVNVTGQDIWGTDIFDDAASGNKSSGTAMLNEMLTVHAKVLEDNTSWLADDAQTISDAANETTLKTETKLGARQQLYNNVKTMLGNQNELITQDITDVDSTDVAALAVKLMEDQTVYNLSLALGARILPQSLADYLS